MKITVKRPVEIEVTHIRIHLPVRYEEEDIPKDFPMRNGYIWEAVVNIDTGRIEGWPQGKSGNLEMKVCDEGLYQLLDIGGKNEIVATLDQEYVPHGVIPGEYGDYVKLDIAEDGTIKNWPRQLNLAKFFGDDED